MPVFGLRSFTIGRFFGIPLEVNSSWFLVFFLVAYTLSTSYLPAAMPGQPSSVHVFIALAMTAAFFASIVLHEFAHSLVARAGGLKISRITLFVFGGVSQMEDEPTGPGLEFLMAFAGPAMSLVLSAVCFGAMALMRSAHVTSTLLIPVQYLAYINLSVAVFNLLPGFPLDGGRVLRSILWALTGDMLKATRWASRMGQLLGYALIAIAVVGVLNGSLDLIWFAVMGWFLSTLAGAAYQQQLLKVRLSEVPLSAVMSSPVAFVSSDTTLEEMAHSYFLGGRHSRYPVVSEGKVIGLIELQAMRDMPRDEWASKTVGEAAHTDLAAVVATPDVTIDRVLSRLEPSGPGAVLVVEDGRLAGIVTRADVIRLVSSMDRQQ
ncbi:MAG: site-2 protease family protein [Actinobacteria bacterium HGW-Actinobacteria-1]|jgi:Zn-dependent protease|nr:MAG: site-2 protease family protein [Actinobacteria bacterium HGW-Actinobacteria-1]